jgi:multiple sugar transport system permease protein
VGDLQPPAEKLGFASVPWLAQHDTALGAVMVFHIWKYLPFWTIIFLAGRRAIPNELYEATAIDGASPVQNFVYVTFPLLRNLYLICTLLSMVFTLGDFTVPWLMTGGAPGDSTHVLATLAYRYTFQMGRLEWGLATFAVALPVTLGFIALLLRWVKI